MIRNCLIAIGLVTGLGILLPAVPASADETGRIVEVKRDTGTLRIVFQADGLPDGVSLDPDSVMVRIADKPVASSAKPLTSRDDIARVAILAMDNSQSMSGES